MYFVVNIMIQVHSQISLLSLRAGDLSGLLCHACCRESDAFIRERHNHKTITLDLGVI